MKASNKNFLAAILSVFLMTIILPVFFLELFPFSVYPMLSDSWSRYALVEGNSDAANSFLKEKRVNPSYFGIPQGLPIGRAYLQTLLLFGKEYSVSEVKELMGLLKFEKELCFTLKNFGQTTTGSYGVKSAKSFCLGPAK